MSRALVIGGSGFVGRRLTALLGDAGLGAYATRPVEGMVRFDATAERLRDRLPGMPADLTHVFVPFGAIEMDGCALEPERTRKVNVDAVQAVLGDALDAGLFPVFVSTDYVFDGTRGDWRETDEPKPRMAYGAQKLEVEGWLARRRQPYLTVRLSKVVSADLSSSNMLSGWWSDIRDGRAIRCATDQIFSPGWIDDLARTMIQLAATGAEGLFHLGGPEAYSRLRLLETLIASARNGGRIGEVAVASCRLGDFAFAENRPLNTSLCTEKLRDHLPELSFRGMADLCDEFVTNA